MMTVLPAPRKVTLATAAGPGAASSAWNPWSGLQYSRRAPAGRHSAITLPSGDTSSVPAAVEADWAGAGAARRVCRVCLDADGRGLADETAGLPAGLIAVGRPLAS